MNLGHLFTACQIPVPDGAADLDVRTVTYDSRKVGPGALFVAIGGFHRDGHEFIAEAVKRGAVAIVAEKRSRTKAPVAIVKDSRAALADLAAELFDHPTHSRGRKRMHDLLMGALGRCLPILHLRGGLHRPARTLPTVIDQPVVCDREHPRAQVLAVLEPRVGAQRSQKGLLKGVLGPVVAEAAVEETKDLVPVGVVKGLEGWDHHS